MSYKKWGWSDVFNTFIIHQHGNDVTSNINRYTMECSLCREPVPMEWVEILANEVWS